MDCLRALGSGTLVSSTVWLIPTGSHQVLNTIVWFQIANCTNAAGTVFHGVISTVSMPGDGTAGCSLALFPIMMFGLPGGAGNVLRGVRKSVVRWFSADASVAVKAFRPGVTELLVPDYVPCTAVAIPRTAGITRC